MRVLFLLCFLLPRSAIDRIGTALLPLAIAHALQPHRFLLGAPYSRDIALDLARNKMCTSLEGCAARVSYFYGFHRQRTQSRKRRMPFFRSYIRGISGRLLYRSTKQKVQKIQHAFELSALAEVNEAKTNIELPLLYIGSDRGFYSSVFALSNRRTVLCYRILYYKQASVLSSLCEVCKEAYFFSFHFQLLI